MKVAIFEGSNYLSLELRTRGIKRLDERINIFLSEHPNIEIKHIKQSSASDGYSDEFTSTTIISIWYEE